MISLEEQIRETNLSKPCTWTKRLALRTVVAGELLSETETKNVYIHTAGGSDPLLRRDMLKYDEFIRMGKTSRS